MRKESKQLQDIREHLASLGEHMTDLEGVDLADEFTEFVTDVQEEGYSNAEEETIFFNLLQTYARKAEKIANDMLNDFDSVVEEMALCLQHTMHNFESVCNSLPPSFYKTMVLLLERIAERRLHLYRNPPRYSDSHGPFVASKDRDKFHRLECKWALEIIDPIEYESHEEAVHAGKKPCLTCRA